MGSKNGEAVANRDAPPQEDEDCDIVLSTNIYIDAVLGKLFR